MTTTFLPAIREAMHSLATEYGLRIAREWEDSTHSEVQYVNQTTGMRVVVDWTEFRPFIWLSRLVAGAPPPPRPVFVPEWGPFPEIDADAPLRLRAGKADLPIGKEFGKRDPELVRDILARYADALSTNIGEVFRGDFAILDQAERHLRERKID